MGIQLPKMPILKVIIRRIGTLALVMGDHEDARTRVDELCQVLIESILTDEEKGWVVEQLKRFVRTCNFRAAGAILQETLTNLNPPKPRKPRRGILAQGPVESPPGSHQFI